MERRIQTVQSEIVNMSGATPFPNAFGPNPSVVNAPLVAAYGPAASPLYANANGGSLPIYGTSPSPMGTTFGIWPVAAASPMPALSYPPSNPNSPSGPWNLAPSAPRSPYAGATPSPFAPSFSPAAFSREGQSTREIRNLPAAPHIPDVNFIDSGERYLIHIGLPGVKKDNLDLTVTERTITVDAEVKPDLPDGTVIVAEALPVAFRRTIALPTAVNSNKCKATLKDGFLTLDLPKREPTERPHRVDVAYG